VNTLSYNQLVDRIITNKGSQDPDINSESMFIQYAFIPNYYKIFLVFIAEEFLNQSASQLTRYGLECLIDRVKEDELCVLFRNNHFITLYKHKVGFYLTSIALNNHFFYLKKKLFQLVTDQGFLTESNMVWETLNNIEGDTLFVDGDFVLVPPKPNIALSPTGFTNTQQQIDQE